MGEGTNHSKNRFLFHLFQIKQELLRKGTPSNMENMGVYEGPLERLVNTGDGNDSGERKKRLGGYPSTTSTQKIIPGSVPTISFVLPDRKGLQHPER